MNRKNGPILSWWKNIEERWFSDSTKEVDGFFKKAWLFLKQSFAVIVDALLGTKIISHSASMTYFTLIVSVPFVAIILLLSNNWIGLNDQLNSIIDYTLGDGIYEKIEQSALSSIVSEKQKYGGLIAIVIVMTIICLRSFFIGLQRELNKIWGCNDRTFPSADIFGILTAVAVIIGVALWGWLLPMSSNPFYSYLFSIVVVGLLLWGGFYYIPNSRKVGIWPSLAAASLCSLIVVLAWKIIPKLTLRPNGYSSLAVLFTVLFVVFCSWFIFFIAAELCSVWDRSNDKYLKGSIEHISPFYQDTLTIYAASYIFRTFYYSHKRVTMDQIRRGMFRNEKVQNGVKYNKADHGKLIRKSVFKNIYKIEEGKYICLFRDEFGEKKMIQTSTQVEAEDIAASCKATGRAHLPISIMNVILDRLVQQDILDYEDTTAHGKRFRYYFPKGNSNGDIDSTPRMDPNTATVGDLLFQLRMGGRHSLKYNYSSSGIQLIGHIRDSEISFMKEQACLLKDLNIQIDMGKIVHNTSISAEDSLWLLYKGDIDIKEMRNYIEQCVPVIGKQEYIDTLKDLEDNDPMLNGYDKNLLIQMTNEFEV